ncbi:MAG: AmmeMemoRadiSam system protein A [Pseudomonadota bacterium]|nr:MAG: AmmeMemoRadiSam system protein A [Pseudomonadota bacterium]
MLDQSLRATLLDTASRSIRHGLDHGRPLPVTPSDFPEELRSHRAAFVTLTIHAALRGCIGSLEATRPLIEDVADNAFAAAFRDPRFPPLGEEEFHQLHYHLSILDIPELMMFSSEQDLVSQLRPGTDGLILEEAGRRSTFLPQVWETLKEPRDFLQHLKLKAGLPPDHWSDTIKLSRYTVEDFESAS